MPKDNFRFWFPGEFVKAVEEKDGKKKEKMYFQGFASSNRKDLDGENLAQKGLDITYLNERGIVNWNHSKDPLHIIGEPAQAEFVDGKLWVKAALYDDQEMAQKVYHLGKVLKNNSSKRKLGYSIEGKVLERDPFNKGKVLKALVTNVAITINPKNADSIIDIVKGEFNGFDDGEQPENYTSLNLDDEIQKAEKSEELIVDIVKKDGTKVQVTKDLEVMIKACTTENSKELIPESIDGVKENIITKKESNELNDNAEKPENEDEEENGMTKSEVLCEIARRNSVISFEKANKIFEKLNELTMAAKENKTPITNDLLTKAMESIGISEATETNDEGNADDTVEKGEEGENIDTSVTETGNYVSQEQFEELKKGIAEGFGEIKEFIKNSAIISKGGYDLTKSLTETVEELSERLDSFTNQVPARKAIIPAKVAPVSRNFNKGVENDLAGNDRKRIGVYAGKSAVLNALDKIAFKEGGAMDERAANAMTIFEASNHFDSSFKKAVEDQLGVEIYDDVAGAF